MAATVGLVLAAVSIGEPLIKAICGLRRAYCATNNASDALNRLEHTGNTIHLYLKKVDDGLRRNPSECTEDFTQWFEDEKKVLKHSVSEIDEFTEKFQQRLYTSTVLGAITYVMDEREILKIENRLASHINILDCMKRICQQESPESRVAALGQMDTKNLRAQTASSLAACSESWCNVSSSNDGFGSVDNELSYEEVLKNSNAYKRAAMRKLLSSNNTAGEPLVPDIVLSNHPVPPKRLESQSHFSPHTSETISNSLQSHAADPPSSHDNHSHSSNSYPVWSTQDTGRATSFSTPMTTQADESWNDLGPDVKHHEHQMSVKVEIEGFGYRLMQLDQLNRANVYEQVAVTISSLRDDILRSVNKDYLGQSLTPRDRGIVAYKTMKEPEAGVMLPFNSGFLVGAVEELNTGFYTKLLVFATFVLPQTGEEQTQATIVLERSNMDKDMRHNPARFPSIETVLEIPRPSISHIWPQHCCHPTEGHSSSWSVKWISENFIRCPVGHSSAHVLMLDGPQWIEKQAIAKGGSSTVYKVKISPLFHSWVGDLDTFALKVLKPEHKHTFERELQAHIQLASKNNPHIVPLLMAYERDSHFHLLFPLADGTLKDLFHHCNAHSSLEISSWTGLQLAALAGALETIHVAKFHHSLKTSMAESRIVHFGTHGDLKPSNILCFPGSHGLGILKLSDFGLTRLRSHDLKRRSVNLEKGVTGTLGYLAPDPISSTASDIWSLGCILLEALTWLAGGPQSLVSLHSARFKDGDGRGYITNPDGSLRLHSSLSDPRSWVRSIIEKRRLEDDNPLVVDNASRESLLDIYCHLVERCLDLEPTRRPSAREVAEYLEMAVDRIQTGTSKRLVRDLCIPGLKVCQMDAGLTLPYDMDILVEHVKWSADLQQIYWSSINSARAEPMLRACSVPDAGESPILRNVLRAVAYWGHPGIGASFTNGSDNRSNFFQIRTKLLKQLGLGVPTKVVHVKNVVNRCPLWGLGGVGRSISYCAYSYVVRLLLTEGAYLQVASKHGVTPLHLASNSRYIDVVRLLFEKEANLKVASEYGATPLQLASTSGQIDAVMFLLTNGADLKVASEHGATLLHLASNSSYIDVVRRLFEEKAEWSVASMHGVMLSKIPESNAYELTSSLEMALLELWWLVGVVVREEAARGSVL